MKRFLSVITLSILIVPSVAFASWWNPLTWNSGTTNQSIQVSSLNIQIESLQKTIAQQNLEIDSLNNTITSLSSTTPPNTTTTAQKITTVTKYLPCPSAPVKSMPPSAQAGISTGSTASGTSQPAVASLDYSTYKTVLLDDFVKNPYAYANQPIVINGASIASFIPFSSTAYNAGFLKIGSNADAVMLEAPTTDEYTKISQGLNVGDSIIVYGTGAVTEQFQGVSSTGIPYNSYFPVISIDRIDKVVSCGTKCFNVGGSLNMYVFSK